MVKRLSFWRVKDQPEAERCANKTAFMAEPILGEWTTAAFSIVRWPLNP